MMNSKKITQKVVHLMEDLILVQYHFNIENLNKHPEC